MDALGLGEDEEEEEEEDDESAIDVEDEAQLAARGLRKIMIEGSEEPFLLDLEGNIFSMNGDFMGNMGGGAMEEGEEEEEDEESSQQANDNTLGVEVLLEEEEHEQEEEVKHPAHRELESALGHSTTVGKLNVVLEEKESSGEERPSEAGAAGPTDVHSLETEDAIIRRTARGELRQELEKFRLGDVGLLEHEAGKADNMKNVFLFLVLLVVLAFFTAVSCFVAYTAEAVVAAAIFYIWLLAMALELLVTRNLVCLGIAVYKHCRRRAKEEELVNLSKNPRFYQELFKKYPRSFITKDVRPVEQDVEIARLEGDVHYGGEGFEVGEFSEHYSGEFDDPIAGRRGRFEVINEINIYDCRDREDRESRFGDLEDLEPPCFNRDLPGIDFAQEGIPMAGAFSFADETINELGEYNMLLVD